MVKAVILNAQWHLTNHLTMKLSNIQAPYEADVNGRVNQIKVLFVMKGKHNYVLRIENVQN